MIIYAVLCKSLLHAGKLGISLFARDRIRQGVDFRRIDGRTILPDFVYQVYIVNNFTAGSVFFAVLEADNAPVKAQFKTFSRDGRQIVFDFRNAWLLAFHHGDAGAVKLFCRLDKIAAVSPESGVIFGYQQGAVGASEAGQVLPAFKIIVDVFGAVKIGGRHQIAVQSMFLHDGAKTCNFLFHISNFLLF